MPVVMQMLVLVGNHVFWHDVIIPPDIGVEYAELTFVDVGFDERDVGSVPAVTSEGDGSDFLEELRS